MQQLRHEARLRQELLPYIQPTRLFQTPTAKPTKSLLSLTIKAQLEP